HLVRRAAVVERLPLAVAILMRDDDRVARTFLEVGDHAGADGAAVAAFRNVAGAAGAGRTRGAARARVTRRTSGARRATRACGAAGAAARAQTGGAHLARRAQIVARAAVL